MKSFTANENDSGQRLDKYLSKILDIPKTLMYKYMRTGHIKVNKKKKPGDYIIVPGDIINLYIDDSFFKEKQSLSLLKGDLDIVYESDDIIIVNKPPGLLSQPDSSGKASLCDYIKSYLADIGEYTPESGHSFSPAICNRLDTNTSGLVIAAKNAESLRLINEKIKNREIKKYYKCIVKGIPDRKSAVLKGYISKCKKTNISTVSSSFSEGSLYIETAYKTLKSGENSLLEVELRTGRSHQIRAHMSSIGNPLLGDFKYGGGKGTQKLCAYKLVFDFEDNTGRLDYLKGKTFEISPPFTNEV